LVQTIFEPELIGLEMDGIHESVYNTVMKCDMDIRRDLYSNIILSGGTTMFPGTVRVKCAVGDGGSRHGGAIKEGDIRIGPVECARAGSGSRREEVFSLDGRIRSGVAVYIQGHVDH